jgi:glycosyltransferase involved in cell wall biosynthesis
MLAGQRDITVIPGPNRGLGANLNRLIASTPDDYLFQLDDDHLLLGRLELNRHVIKLRDDQTAGWIRLMGIGYHDYIARLEENYWRIYWQSPEKYIPSNRPHLKHRRFHDHFGLYPEDVSLAETEDGFCDQCKARKGGPAVLVPLDVLTESGWDHVGESWQLKGE